MKYWVSWYHNLDYSEFELHSPWWISGYAYGAEDKQTQTICAAIVANSEEEAKQTVYGSYDIRPEDIEFRFCDKQADDWSPFGSRFRKASWMEWSD